MGKIITAILGFLKDDCYQCPNKGRCECIKSCLRECSKCNEMSMANSSVILFNTSPFHAAHVSHCLNEGCNNSEVLDIGKT